MDRYELLSRISSFPLVVNSLAEGLLSGAYRSVFKGQGMEFDEVRHYEQGDDIRAIDWNVSARFAEPYVKMFREEREMTLCVILDCSASMTAAARGDGGEGALSRYEQGVLAAALLAFSAETAGQQVSAVFFDREITRIYPPRKGRQRLLVMISAALEARPAGRGSNLGGALAGAGRLLKNRSLVVVISDFLSLGWEQELAALGRGHDLISIRISDPLDEEFPPEGLLTMTDRETGLVIHAPSGFAAFRRSWRDWHRERASSAEAIIRRSLSAYIALSTADDAARVLRRYFGERKQSSAVSGEVL